MGLFPVNPLVSGAVRTYALLDILDKPVGDPALLLSGMCADRALRAALGHLFIFFGCRRRVHGTAS